MAVLLLLLLTPLLSLHALPCKLGHQGCPT